jgi:hypothetical protein
MAEEYGIAGTDGVDAIVHGSDMPLSDDVTVQPMSVTCDRPLLDGQVTLCTESKTVSGTEFQGSTSPCIDHGGVELTSTETTGQCAASLTTDGSQLSPSTVEPSPLPPSSSSVPVSPVEGLTDVNDDVNQLLNQTQSSSFESSQSTTTSHDSVETVQSFRHQPKIATDVVDIDFESKANSAEAAISEPVSADAAQISDAVDTVEPAAVTAEADDHVVNPSDVANVVEQPALPEEPPVPTAEFKAGERFSVFSRDQTNRIHIRTTISCHKRYVRVIRVKGH